MAADGTLGELATAAGVELGAPVGIYHDSPNLGSAHRLAVHPAATVLIADGFARGDAGLRTFVPEVEPVLWPEHFDLGISLDEVNYGVSPGDAGYPRPYAYVGPFTPRDGDFWNAPFGSMRWLDDLPDASSITEYFTEGRARTA